MRPTIRSESTAAGLPLHLLMVGWILGGCSLFGDGDNGPGAMSPEELRAVPQSVRIDGKRLELETYMWRDFMPISPPDGKALIAIFQVYTIDSSDIPDGLSTDAAWVVNGDRVWGTFFEDEEPSQPLTNRLERVARDGPKWGPHVEVDAVVRLHAADGTTHLLRAADQVIGRTS